jgi:hypothetical protein
LFADSQAIPAALLQRLEEITINVEHSFTTTDEERLQNSLTKAHKVKRRSKKNNLRYNDEMRKC